MWPKKIRLFLGVLWIIVGVLKILTLVGELITGKALISLSFPFFVELTVVPFCTDMVSNYILPHAQLAILIAVMVEILTGFLILQPRGWAKLGLLLGIFMIVIYSPLVGWFMVIISILFFAVPHMWIMGQDLNDNLFKKLLKK